METFVQGLIENKRQQRIVSFLTLFFALSGLPVLSAFAQWLFLLLIALVTLRKGLVGGRVLLATCCVICGVFVTFSAGSEMFFLVAMVTGLFLFKSMMMVVASHVLRQNERWSQVALFYLVVMCGLVVVGSALFIEEKSLLYQWISDLFVANDSSGVEGVPFGLIPYVFGSMISYELFYMTLLLVFARFLQAQCYYPEGFYPEWFSMRMGPGFYRVFGVVSLLVFPFLLSQEPFLLGDEVLTVLFEVYILMFFPCCIESCALLHSVAHHKQSYRLIFILYAIVLLFYPVFSPVLAMLALVDYFFDLRNRYKIC